jgi:hypothetical protein
MFQLIGRQRLGRLTGRSARLALMGVVLCALAPGVASAKSFVWSGPTQINAGAKSDTFAGTLQCPSTTICTAAGADLGASYDGYIIAFNPLHPGTVTAVHIPPPAGLSVPPGGISEPRFNDLSCPSVTQCSAVNGAVYTYDPSAPGAGTMTTAPSGSEYDGHISCPAATQCTTSETTTGGSGTVSPPPGQVTYVTFNPQGPASQTVNVLNVGANSQGDTNAVDDLSCGSVSACTVINAEGEEYTFDPQVASTTPPAGAVVDPSPSPLDNLHLNCPAADECVMAARSGHEVTFDPGNPGAPSVVTLDSDGGYVAALTCPSAAQCTIVDANGRAVTFDPTSPTATASVTQVADGDTQASVACASLTQCESLGIAGSGTLYLGQPGTPPTAGTSTSSKPLVKGTAASVAVSCASNLDLACAVKLTLTARVKGYPETLGSVTRRIAAGKKATVTVHLSRTGFNLLSTAKRLPVTLTQTAKGAKTVTRTVIFERR